MENGGCGTEHGGGRRCGSCYRIGDLLAELVLIVVILAMLGSFPGLVVVCVVFVVEMVVNVVFIPLR